MKFSDVRIDPQLAKSVSDYPELWLYVMQAEDEEAELIL